jgi:hypothetical protein
MSRTSLPVLSRRRRIPLALAVASALALSLPASASATTWVVNSCVDDANSATTAGTLRYAVAHAIDPNLLQLPDTVDMSSLTGGSACPGGKLTLTQGYLTVSQRSLIFNGPGPATLTISRTGSCGIACDDRVITHTGTGPLVINNLGVSDGNVYHTGIAAVGGCVYSKGSVALDHVTVSACSAFTQSSAYAAAGGAIYAAKNVSLAYSTISGNSLGSNDSARGGGVYGKGDISLDHSTISGNSASAYHGAMGGGVFTLGAAELVESSVSGNMLSATSNTDGHAYGGGIYAKGNATINTSSIGANTADGYYGAVGGGLVGLGTVDMSGAFITGNSATASAKSSAVRGGGVAAVGDFSAKETTIDANHASGGGGSAGSLGGGLVAYHGMSLVRSTISHNGSTGSAGGILGASVDAATTSVYVQSSTISGNTAAYVVGGAFFNSATVGLYNSTVAFNSAGAGYLGAVFPLDYYAPGVALTGMNTAMSVTLQSTILSNNTYGPSESEVDLSSAKTMSNGVKFNASPANNYVRAFILAGSTLPDDTLPDPQKITCPLLGPLRDNGGPTMTHALLSGSPAIDAGNDVLHLTDDQRGDGYPRESNGIADIGAYEVDQTDIVFNSSLEGCPKL